MKNVIKIDIEIVEDNDKIVSYDTNDIIDFSKVDIDHLSLKQLLQLIKQISPEKIEVVSRGKNLEFQNRYNLSDLDLIREIKSLQPNDYYDGPIIDDNKERIHPVWIFKKYVRSIYCYIKLKVINHGRIIIIISFHEDESNQRRAK